MNLQVTPHTITIQQTEDINAGEYNVSICTFNLSEEYDELTNRAIFTNCDSVVEYQDIVNNQCYIPYSMLEKPGKVIIGVYGYETENDELKLRYSPRPELFTVLKGSYKEGQQPTPPTPSGWDQLVEQVNRNTESIQQLNELIGDIDNILETIDTGGGV